MGTMVISPFDVKLDIKNPRVIMSPNPNQNDLRLYLLDQEDIVDLAKGMLKYGGLIPGERIIVFEEQNEFYVLEGNRRICACQLFLNPDLLPPKYKNQFPSVTNALKLNIEKIEVDIVPDRKSNLKVISIRHIDGVKPWNPISKLKFFADLYEEGNDFEEIKEITHEKSGKIKNSLQDYYLLKYALDLPVWTDEQKLILHNLPQLKPSKYLRIFDVNDAADKLKLSFDKDTFKPKSELPKEVFDKAVELIATAAFITNTIDTRSTLTDVPGINSVINQKENVSTKSENASKSKNNTVQLILLGETTITAEQNAVLDESKNDQEQSAVLDESKNDTEQTTILDETKNAADQNVVLDNSKNDQEQSAVLDESKNDTEQTTVLDETKNAAEQNSVLDGSKNDQEQSVVLDESKNDTEQITILDETKNAVEQNSVLDESKNELEDTAVSDETKNAAEQIAVLDESKSNVEQTGTLDENEKGQTAALNDISAPNTQKESNSPSIPKPPLFFENLTCAITNSDPDGIGIIYLATEIRDISTQNYLNKFPIAAAMLLRSLLEQSLKYHLKKINEWDKLKAKYTSNEPALQPIINHIRANLNIIFPEKTQQRLFNSIFDNPGLKDYLDLVIHHPNLIQIDKQILHSTATTGLKSLIELILNHKYN